MTGVSRASRFFYHGNMKLILAREPDNYTRISLESGNTVMAHGRILSSGWPDNPFSSIMESPVAGGTDQQIDQRLPDSGDGVPCDMAMLVLPEVFERTWGIRCRPFWPKLPRRVP